MDEEWDAEKRKYTIQNIYNELTDSKHPVSIALSTVEEVQEVRIIERLDKV